MEPVALPRYQRSECMGCRKCMKSARQPGAQGLPHYNDLAKSTQFKLRLCAHARVAQGHVAVDGWLHLNRNALEVAGGRVVILLPLGSGESDRGAGPTGTCLLLRHTCTVPRPCAQPICRSPAVAVAHARVCLPLTRPAGTSEVVGCPHAPPGVTPAFDVLESHIVSHSTL
jgi:hypothetical protein